MVLTAWTFKHNEMKVYVSICLVSMAFLLVKGPTAEYFTQSHITWLAFALQHI